jgi:hypothetical protein
VPSLSSHPEADVEAEEAAVWFEGRQPGLGRDFLTELERAYAMIQEAPATWPLWPRLPESLGVRRFLLARFPYGIAYDSFGEDVIVYAVAHLSRRPGYWKERLKA